MAEDRQTLLSFQEELENEQRSGLGVAIAVGVVLLFTTLVLDFLYSKRPYQLLGLRAPIVTALGITWWLVKTRKVQPFMGAVVVSLSMSVFIAAGAIVNNGWESIYWSAYFVLFVGLSAVIPLTAKETLLVFGVALPLYPLSLWAFDPHAAQGFDVIVRNTNMLLCAAVLGIAGARQGERVREAEYQARAELARQQALSAIRLLTSTVAHELVNPLSALRAAIEELRLGVTDESDRKQLLNLANDAAERVGQILEGFRAHGSGRDRTQTPADVRAELDAALMLARPSLSGIEVLRDYREVPRINCRPRELGQVFLNLIINAAQAMGDQGKLVLAVKETEDHVVVEFADTGPGIAAENKPKLFQPFFTTKTPGVGTGLGLWFSDAVVKSHGGSIEVEDVQPHGAKFRIHLPKPNQAIVPAA